MKIIQTLSVILLLLASELFAQLPQGRRVRITLSPTYQSWNLEFDAAAAGGVTQTDIDFSEFSFPLTIYVPVGRSLGLSIRSSQASADSDQLESISSIADTQLGLSYLLSRANIILNANINLPTGKTELSSDEFETTSLIGNNIFSLRIPNFGRGTNVSAVFTWAYPATEKLVLGLGASYQLRGSFRPLADLLEDYDPGDEILLTAGFDARLGATASLSTDVIFTLFGTDKVGDEDVFASGSRIVVTTQLRKHIGFDEFRLLARYRTKAKNEQALILGQPLAEEVDNSFGNQIEILANYRRRFSRKFYGKVLIDGRFYQEAAGFRTFATTPGSAGITLLGFGIGPELIVSRRVTVPITLKYFMGSFDNGPDVTGFEAGIGLQLSY